MKPLLEYINKKSSSDYSIKVTANTSAIQLRIMLEDNGFEYCLSGEKYRKRGLDAKCVNELMKCKSFFYFYEDGYMAPDVFYVYPGEGGKYLIISFRRTGELSTSLIVRADNNTISSILPNNPHDIEELNKCLNL